MVPVTAVRVAQPVIGQAVVWNGTQYITTNTLTGTVIADNFQGDGSGLTNVVHSVALTVPTWLTVSGSPITNTGTLAVTAAGGQTANSVLATPNGSSGALAVRTLVDGDVSGVHLNALAVPTGDVSLNGHKIVSLADGSTSTDAASWGQVQTLVSSAVGGLDWKASVRVATSSDINISTPGTNPTIDGVTIVDGERVLLYGQTAASENGIYTYHNPGGPAPQFTRSSDANISADVTAGMTCQVTEGTKAGQLGVLVTPDPITLGTTALSFTLLAGPTAYSSGTGIDITGSVISISTGYTGQTSITTLGTVVTGTWNASTLALVHGGTGATTQAGAANAVLPTQASNSGKFLTTDGSNASWGTAGSVTSVALTTPSWLTVAGSPVTSSGTLAVTATGGQAASQFLATPSGSTGAVGLRVIAGADLPFPASSSLGGVQSLAVVAHKWINTISTTGVPAATQPSFDDLSVPTGAVSFGSQRLTTLADPSSAQDAATKNYVDATIQGLQIKPTARLATTAALAANTYSNGTAGVGATLTATGNGALSVDSVTVVAADILLIKNEATGANNGLYTVTQVGDGSHPYILTRHADMDQPAEINGAFVPVGSAGTANANSLWLANPSGAVTVGTTTIPFTQLNGATDLIPGTGITISGNTVSISTSYVGQTSITTLGTIATGGWQGTKIAEGFGGTNQSTYTLGDLLYASGANTLAKLAGNILATKKFLTQTGTGSVSVAPGWNVIVMGDLGTGTTDGTTFLRGDGTFTNKITGAFASGAVTLTVTTNTVTPTATGGNEYNFSNGADTTVNIPTGTPLADGQVMTIRFKNTDGGSPHTLTMSSGTNGFRLGTDIVAGDLSAGAGKTLYVGCRWNSVDSKWDVVSKIGGF